MKVLFNDLGRGVHLHWDEYEKAALGVLASGWYILGQEVSTFEKAFAEKIGVKHCIGVDNGLNAIKLGLEALGIGLGDEVIVQANTYIATVLGITHNNAMPIFVEPDRYYGIDTLKIEEAITLKTKAILATHLYGQASEMDSLVAICDRYNLILLEDCAQSHFASYRGKYTGSFGSAGFFSFYPTKTLGAFGDAGAIITNDDQLADRLRKLRNYGSQRKYYNEIPGYNSRLDELQAGLLKVKLRHIDNLISDRRLIAERYLANIRNESILLPLVRTESNHVWHLFVICTHYRDTFREYLLNHGISTEVHYPIPPHLSVAYKNLGYKSGDFPLTEAYSNEVVSLPLFDGMTIEEADWVINVVNDFKV